MVASGADAAPRGLTTARKMYKDAQYLKAASVYEAIDMDSPDYLRSREELAWSYLRAGEWAKLRGVLTHLNTNLVPLRWRLEGRVMSAMLYLRDCQYEKVKDEVALFQQEMGPFIRKVSRSAQKSENKAYWQALQAEAGEAVFKMKFVRMELRSRLVILTREQVVEPQSTKGLTSKLPTEAQTFPVGKDLWADEIFMARGEGNPVCAEIHKTKVTR
jgi:hypothetical protein